MNHIALRPTTVLRLWVPLALTWAMMSLEGPILQSVVSRLPDAATNLAAFGVAIGIAFVVESPIIMLLSASTAYVKGAESYRVVHRVSLGLSLAVTIAMLLLVFPPVYALIATSILALPPHIAERVQQCLIALVFWPGAIGIRRFYQGVIIRARMNRYIAFGTMFRLATILAGGIALLASTGTKSAVVAAAILGSAVAIETIATWFMARRAVQLTLETTDPDNYNLTALRLLRLYTPLALTSIIAMGLGPVLVGFMSRFPAAIVSLAVYPVVDGLVFQFRAPLFAYQELAISLFATHGFLERTIARTGYGIAAFATVVLVLITFTPMADFVYGTFPYRLDVSSVGVATIATAILLPLPLVSAVYSIHRAALIVAHHPEQVTYSTLVEAVVTVVVAGLFAVARVPIVGVYAITGALTIGKLAASVQLWSATSRYLSRRG